MSDIKKPKMGRPKKEINKVDFEGLCELMCTAEEISGWFDCSVDTIERWCKLTYSETFAEVFKVKSASGKISLRRSQFQAAKDGNSALLIWLGKQYLGQTDKIEIPIQELNLKINYE